MIVECYNHKQIYFVKTSSKRLKLRYSYSILFVFIEIFWCHHVGRGTLFIPKTTEKHPRKNASMKKTAGFDDPCHFDHENDPATVISHVRSRRSCLIGPSHQLKWTIRVKAGSLLVSTLNITVVWLLKSAPSTFTLKDSRELSTFIHWNPSVLTPRTVHFDQRPSRRYSLRSPR